jgi:hypothetical protein
MIELKEITKKEAIEEAMEAIEDAATSKGNIESPIES